MLDGNVWSFKEGFRIEGENLRGLKSFTCQMSILSPGWHIPYLFMWICLCLILLHWYLLLQTTCPWGVPSLVMQSFPMNVCGTRTSAWRALEACYQEARAEITIVTLQDFATICVIIPTHRACSYIVRWKLHFLPNDLKMYLSGELYLDLLK